jgi:hypothetical protein
LEEGAVWARFAGALSAEEFCLSWLTILCRSLAGAQAAFLLLEEEPGQYKVGAAWPDPAGNLAHLAPAAEQALRQGRGLVHQVASGAAHVAYPVEVAGHRQDVPAAKAGRVLPTRHPETEPRVVSLVRGQAAPTGAGGGRNPVV